MAYDFGSGELNPYGAMNPGLVYDMDLMDYFKFLCFYGYNSSTIRLIEPSLPDQFRCPGNSSLDLISDINYPSIAVAKDIAAGPVHVTRTLSNVDEEVDTIYRVSVTAPRGLLVEVEPQRLVFTKARPKMTYRVRFSSNSTIKDAFGAIVWDNGKFKVSCSYVVSA